MEIIKNDGSSIFLVRYFEYQNKQFLIYETSEGIDENGHITIHICEVNTENGVTASTVQTSDMDMIRNIIKTIVKENKNEKLETIKDLDYNNLNGILILNDWPLKMMPNYVDIIKMNQPTFETMNNSVPFNNNFNSFDNLLNNEKPMTDEISMNNTDINLSTLNENIVNNDFSFNNTFDFNSQNEPLFNQNIVSDNTQSNSIDYEKMYYEQLTINNSLNMELEVYKNKIQQIKSIIEN